MKKLKITFWEVVIKIKTPLSALVPFHPRNGAGKFIMEIQII